MLALGARSGASSSESSLLQQCAHSPIRDAEIGGHGLHAHAGQVGMDDEVERDGIESVDEALRSASRSQRLDSGLLAGFDGAEPTSR